MIPRYTPDDMATLWSEPERIRAWLQVELAACRAMADEGLVPEVDVDRLESIAAETDMTALAARAEAIERETKHDVIAFLSAFEEVAGPPARHVHFGLTSNDILDTSFALRLRRATDVVVEALDGLMAAVKKQTEAHRHTPMIGRSHGVHAEPITFGLVTASWYAELARDRRRLLAARDDISVGKLSGAVGTNAHLPPSIETKALSALGLEPETVATQVVARDRHAQYFGTLATLGATLERVSVEIRHLQRTDRKSTRLNSSHYS
mgnify:CR=1 FL=1